MSNFVYHDIRDGLIAQGIPPTEVAFIHDYQTKEQRAALFAAMNAGEVRVLLGSTAKMGTGMNVQQRLIALHNLDCPWRPGDLEQRQGRIRRQGNMWPEVYIFNYVTEGSFDAYLYQIIETKARFIAQVLAGDLTLRRVADTDELVLSAAEVKAIASGDPSIMRKVQLETEIGRLQRVRAVHHATRSRVQHDRSRLEREQADLAARHTILTHALALAARQPGDRFLAQVRSTSTSPTFQSFDTRADAGHALQGLIDHMAADATASTTPQALTVAHYRGFSIHLSAHPRWGTTLTLRLPDDSVLDELTSTSERGVFASADALIRALPRRLAENVARSDDLRARCDQLSAEHTRMATWAGQAAYDAAVAELAAIDAGFVAKAAQPAEPPPAASPLPLNAPTTEVAITEVPHTIPSAHAALALMESALRHDTPPGAEDAHNQSNDLPAKAPTHPPTMPTVPSLPRSIPLLPAPRPATRRPIFGQPPAATGQPRTSAAQPAGIEAVQTTLW